MKQMLVLADRDIKIVAITIPYIFKKLEKNWKCYVRHVAAAATAKSLQSCPTLYLTSQAAAHQAPPSMGFSRKEHWSGLPFPSPVHESEK